MFKKEAMVAVCLLFALPVASFSPIAGTQTRGAKSSSLPMLPKVQSGKRRSGSAALPFALASMAALGIKNADAFLGGDSFVEAEILTDFSHLSTDIAAFLGPGALAIRFLAVIGRVCSIAADYLPDHIINPEELLFQVTMLALAVVGFANAATFSVYSTASKVAVRDGKAFLSLFAPAGTSWAQFKALSVCALDWKAVEAGETLADNDEDEYLYWLYAGNVQVENDGNALYYVSRKAGGASNKHKDAARGLLGERLLVMDPSNKKGKRRITSNFKALTPSTFLRIHAPSIKMLMDNDKEFAESIRTLMFQSMEAKLSGHFKVQPSSGNASLQGP